jgi:hypothetical protein
MVYRSWLPSSSAIGGVITGQLERDTKKLVKQLASDPGYGKATGIFWGSLVVLGMVGALVSKVPGEAWMALGCGLVLVVLVMLAVRAANRRERDRRPK